MRLASQWTLHSVVVICTGRICVGGRSRRDTKLVTARPIPRLGHYVVGRGATDGAVEHKALEHGYIAARDELVVQLYRYRWYRTGLLRDAVQTTAELMATK